MDQALLLLPMKPDQYLKFTHTMEPLMLPPQPPHLKLLLDQQLPKKDHMKLQLQLPQEQFMLSLMILELPLLTTPTAKVL